MKLKSVFIQAKIWTRENNPVSKLKQKKDSDIHSYCEHLDALHSDFSNCKRFEDIMQMNIPDWIFDPFSSAFTEDSPQLQEEMMEIVTNDKLKFKFKSGYQQFWLQKEIPTNLVCH